MHLCMLSIAHTSAIEEVETQNWHSKLQGQTTHVMIFPMAGVVSDLTVCARQFRLSTAPANALY